MKHFLKLIFLFSILSNVYTQNTFSKILAYDSMHVQNIRNVDFIDSTFYITGVKRTGNQNHSKFLITDILGNTIKSTQNENLHFLKDGTARDSFALFVVGQNIPFNLYDINISKYSLIDNTYLNRNIVDTLSGFNFWSIYDVILYQNKLLILGACRDGNENNTIKSFILEVNKDNFNVDQMIIYDKGNQWNNFPQSHITSSGDLAVFSEYVDSNTMGATYRGLVFFDKNLIETKAWYVGGYRPHTKATNFETYITKDNLVLFTFAPNSDQRYESLMAYDLDGNKKWEFTLNYFERMTIHSIQESKSNDILIAGKYDRTRIDGLPWVGFVAKLTKNGKLLWLRSVSSFGGKYEYNGREYANPSDFTTFIELEDEHIMAFGSMDDMYNDGSEFPKANSNIWMVKLDPDGCLDQDRCNYDVTVRTTNDWYIYDQINVLQKEWIYQVTDKNGNKKLINQKFDGDTMLFDRTFDWRKYHQLVTTTSDGVQINTDTLKFRWTREGQLNFMKPWTMYVTYLDSTMYDFTLKNGDSFILPYGFGTASVIKVDSVPLIDGKLRKRIILHHDNKDNHRKFGPLTWIEGIGSPNGLIYYYDWINETKTDLLCYFDRGNKRYSITEAPNCEALTRNTDFAKVINPDNVWYTTKSYAFSPNTSYDRFSFGKDSVLINDKYYFHLRTSIDSTGDTWKLTGKYAREENGKLWLLDNGQSGEEILVMDMNLMVGDTFAVKDVLGPNTYHVANTDVVTDLAGIVRRVIELKCDKDDEFIRYKWIEGIGPDEGVFEANFEQCVIDGSNNLLTCFYTNDIQHYQTSFNLPCWKPREVNVIDISLLSDINIYPNPGLDQIVIEKGNNVILSYQIYTMTGKVLASGKLYDNDKFILSTAEWNSGMYIISINDIKGNYYVGKWVKM